MVRSGVTDTFGGSVRQFLGWSLSNRFKAFMAGLGVTMLLQSSSATAMLATSFSASGLMATSPTLAVLLGADVGTSLVAQALAYDLSLLSPVLIAIGVMLSMGHSGGKRRDLGSIFVGLGLMLLALKLIVAASSPMREAEAIQTIFSALSDDPIMAIIVAAAIAWMAHSSLATILLIMSLSSTGIVSQALAFSLVLGANIGAAMPPIMATMHAKPEARRPPLGNLLFRIGGALVVAPFMDNLLAWTATQNMGGAQLVVNLHTAFNLLLAAIFLPLVGTMAKITEALLPEQQQYPDQQATPSHLSESELDSPPVALANAAHDTLRMAAVVESMFDSTCSALINKDQSLAITTRAKDDVLDNFYDEIRVYLTRLSRRQLGEEDSQRCAEILTYSANLEHIGDIVSINLLDNMIRKKIQREPTLAHINTDHIEALFQPVRDTFSLSFSVFMSNDVTLARQLLARKYKFRNIERKAQRMHLEQLQSSDQQTGDASTFYLDLARDLKRINSHLVAVAYPVLDKAGQLRKTRLKKEMKKLPASHQIISKSKLA